MRKRLAAVAQSVERVIGNDEVHGSDSHHQLQTKTTQPGGFLFGICELKGSGAAARLLPGQIATVLRFKRPASASRRIALR